MRLSQLQASERNREKQQKRRKAPAKPNQWRLLAAHPAFVPILTVWGAALLGLTVVVLPQSVIAQMTAASGGIIPADFARIVIALGGAILGGGLGYIGSAALRSIARSGKSSGDLYSAYNASRMRPIDPAADLGSESLDAPLNEGQFEDSELEVGEEEAVEELAEFEDAAESESDLLAKKPSDKREPTLGELAKRGYEMEAPEEETRQADVAFTHGDFRQALIECCEGATCEADPAEEAAPAIEPQPEESESKPLSLDLGEFAELPGRNAVWVEGDAGKAPEPAEEPADAQEQPAPKLKSVPASALEKLRQKPTEELSLVEMVERFAGALHEHQQSERARQEAHGPGRDAALAEALKALTLFTESGFDKADANSEADQLGQTERDLRDALAKLQTLRGAA